MMCVPEHLGLPARDPARLRDWYVRALDGVLLHELPQTPPVCFVRLPGGLVLEIYPTDLVRAEVADNRLAGWRHLALRVASIEAAQAALAARGVEFAGPIKPAGGGGRVLFFADPEGNLLHLVERPPGSVFTPTPAPTPEAALA